MGRRHESFYTKGTVGGFRVLVSPEEFRKIRNRFLKFRESMKARK